MVFQGLGFSPSRTFICPLDITKITEALSVALDLFARGALVQVALRLEREMEEVVKHKEMVLVARAREYEASRLKNMSQTREVASHQDSIKIPEEAGLRVKVKAVYPMFGVRA